MHPAPQPPTDPNASVSAPTSPNPDAPAQDLKRRLDELEIAKREAELHALRLSWWRRPAYIGALFPTILGILTVTAAFVTNLVKNEIQLLELRKEKLSRELQSFQLDQKALLEAKAAYETQRKEFESKVAQLQSQQATMDVQTHLKTILSAASQQRPTAPCESIKALRQLISEDPTGLRVKVVEAAKDSTTNAVYQSELLALLYLGTTNLHWKDALWKSTLHPDPNSPKSAYLMFGYCFEWPLKDSIEIIELAGQLLSTQELSANQQDDVFDFVRTRLPYSSQFQGRLRKQFSSTQAFFLPIQHARNLVLNQGVPGIYRNHALDVLSSMAPPVALACCATLLAEKESDDFLQPRIVEHLNGKYGSRYVRQLYTKLKCPQSTEASLWKAWMETNHAFIESANEPTFETWRANPEKFDALCPIDL